MPTTPLAHTPDLGPDAALGEPWPKSPLRRASLWLGATAVRALSLMGHGLERLGDAAGVYTVDAEGFDNALASWLSRSQWPARPLRVAITTRAAWARRLPDSRGNFRVEWFQAGTMERADDLLARRGFDAVVSSTAEGRPEIILRESEGREAAWFDWGSARPLSYPALFPVRLDCARISLAADPRTEPHTRLLRALIEAACVLARSEARTSLTDRLAGRVPAGTPRTVEPAADRAVSSALTNLAEVLLETPTSQDQPGDAPALGLVAARVVGAWAATADDRLSDDRRRHFAQAAAAHAPAEPESWFRLAAVQFATLDDASGFNALSRAEALVRTTPDLPIHADQQVFLSAELSADDGQCTTLGRVASGLGLLLSTLAGDKLHYVADDLRDELRFSGLIVGRDQDHRLLLEVVSHFSPPVVPASTAASPAPGTPMTSESPAQAIATPSPFTQPVAPASTRPAPKPARPKRTRAASKPRATSAKPRRKAA